MKKREDSKVPSFVRLRVLTRPTNLVQKVRNKILISLISGWLTGLSVYFSTRNILDEKFGF